VNQSRQPAASPVGTVGYEALSAVTNSLARLAAEGVVSSQQRGAEADGLARISNISSSEILAELGEVQREIAALRASERASKATPPLATPPSARGATVEELREMLSPVSHELRQQRQQVTLRLTLTLTLPLTLALTLTLTLTLTLALTLTLL
jgi:ribosomal protein L29